MKAKTHNPKVIEGMSGRIACLVPLQMNVASPEEGIEKLEKLMVHAVELVFRPVAPEDIPRLIENTLDTASGEQLRRLRITTTNEDDWADTDPGIVR